MIDRVLPELRPMFEAMQAAPGIDYTRSPAELRAEANAGNAQLVRALIGDIELPVVRRHSIPVEGRSITIVEYRPVVGTEILGAHVHFHGGGWWIGSVETADPVCRSFARASGLAVFSVDYRLAPEYQWPIPVEDCYAGLCWVAAEAAALGIDPASISIGGESAGGNLAAAVALMARDRGGPSVVAQWLDVPATDLTIPPVGSMVEFAEGVGLTPADIKKCVEFYVGDQDPGHPYVSPLLAPDLTGLPPAIVTVAELDPIRDQGLAYAERLAAAGVEVRASQWAGHLHATMALTTLSPSAAECQAQVVTAMREFRTVAAGTP